MKLTLHEAIVVVLINKKNFTASQDEIAREINKRGLYQRKDNKLVPGYQIMQRTKMSNGRYDHLFDYKSENEITLRLIKNRKH